MGVVTVVMGTLDIGMLRWLKCFAAVSNLGSLSIPPNLVHEQTHSQVLKFTVHRHHWGAPGRQV